MSTDLTHPLQALIQAAATTPAETGATARYKARLEGATDAVVILADVSSSMEEMAGSRRKIDILREAVDGIFNPISAPGEVGGPMLLCFSSEAHEIAPGHNLPEPYGGTAMHLGLIRAAGYRPRKTLVISDGQPDDRAAALAAADRLTGLIDVIYVGPDSDTDAIAFMRELARRGGGRHQNYDMRRSQQQALAPVIRGLLPK